MWVSASSKSWDVDNRSTNWCLKPEEPGTLSCSWLSAGAETCRFVPTPQDLWLYSKYIVVHYLLFQYLYEGTQICPLPSLHFAFLFSQNALHSVLFVYVCSLVTEGGNLSCSLTEIWGFLLLVLLLQKWWSREKCLLSAFIIARMHSQHLKYIMLKH